jgi:hypothetical protein
MISSICSLKSLNYRALAFCALAVSAICTCATGQSPNDGSPQPPASTGTVWTSDHAQHRIGLSGIRTKQNGRLSLSATELVFTTADRSASIKRAQIFDVFAGEERKETGGIGAWATRMALPFGGGAALAAVTQAQVDLLTIKFRDDHDAYHGAVFILPRGEAVRFQQMFGPVTSHTSKAYQPPACAPNKSSSSLQVAPIVVAGVPVPEEYQVLLYEQLVRRLKESSSDAAILRDGDRSPAAECPNLVVRLKLQTFKKGDAVLRATTGPIGTFVGVTSLGVHLELQDSAGRKLVDKELKASERGDSDSLDIADVIAKSVTKHLKKTHESLVGQHAAGSSGSEI